MVAGIASPAFVFWPVGCGDATTVVISPTVALQIDINDTTVAEDIGNERIPVVNELVAKLPRIGQKPYLAGFALTHPDEDHCRGFEGLLSEVVIGELWFTPRVFWEYKKDLSPDALAFCEEAKRRVALTIRQGGDPGRGHRVRIVGYDELLSKPDYVGFPRDWFTIPGNLITTLDGHDLSGAFHAFVHAPFKDDSAGERNETSLALQIGLAGNGGVGYGLFLGDLSYPTIRRIVDETRAHKNLHFLQWDFLLSPHHCSKMAMYQRENGVDVLKPDILAELEDLQRGNGVIVVSSVEVPGNNSPGDNPPHAKARSRYEEIANGGVVCTAEFSQPQNQRPIVATITSAGITIDSSAFSLCPDNAALLTAALDAVQGGSGPPRHKVGFGQ